MTDSVSCNHLGCITLQLHQQGARYKFPSNSVVSLKLKVKSIATEVNFDFIWLGSFSSPWFDFLSLLFNPFCIPFDLFALPLHFLLGPRSPRSSVGGFGSRLDLVWISFEISYGYHVFSSIR